MGIYKFKVNYCCGCGQQFEPLANLRKRRFTPYLCHACNVANRSATQRRFRNGGVDPKQEPPKPVEQPQTSPKRMRVLGVYMSGGKP